MSANDFVLESKLTTVGTSINYLLTKQTLPPHIQIVHIRTFCTVRLIFACLSAGQTVFEISLTLEAFRPKIIKRVNTLNALNWLIHRRLATGFTITYCLIAGNALIIRVKIIVITLSTQYIVSDGNLPTSLAVHYSISAGFTQRTSFNLVKVSLTLIALINARVAGSTMRISTVTQH